LKIAAKIDPVDGSYFRGPIAPLLDTVNEAIAALPHVIALERENVRRRFEQSFSAARMAKDYVGVYRSLLASAQFVGGTDEIQLPLINGGDANIELSIA
jgi:hypothetical protein